MQHLVVSKFGHPYERRLIEQYLAQNAKCPITGQDLGADDLIAVQSTCATQCRAAFWAVGVERRSCCGGLFFFFFFFYLLLRLSLFLARIVVPWTDGGGCARLVFIAAFAVDKNQMCILLLLMQFNNVTRNCARLPLVRRFTHSSFPSSSPLASPPPPHIPPTAASAAHAPRPASATSIPGMLQLFQNEWDALTLETFQLKQELEATRLELSKALYENDAATRVIARLLKERNDARTALAQASANGAGAAALPPGKRTHSSAMETDSSAAAAAAAAAAPAESLISASVLSAFKETAAVLSQRRRGRRAPATLIRWAHGGRSIF